MTLCGQSHAAEPVFNCDDCDRIANVARNERIEHLRKQRDILRDQAARIERRLKEIDRELGDT